MSDDLILVQLVAILATSQLLARAFRHIGQPAVVGEMVAGFVLGPMVLGAISPETHARLFSQAVSSGLSAVASLGVVLFMFVVGVELRQAHNGAVRWGSAASVGLCSVLAPLALGITIAPLVYPSMAPVGVEPWPFALFLGTALSVTAFPVLARILKDRRMTSSKVGQLALSAAAMADLFSWALLLVVIGLGRNEPERRGLSFGGTLLGLIALCLLLHFVVRPLVERALRSQMLEGQMSFTLLAVLLAGLFGCAEATEWLGLHRVFGAFLFGVTLPRDKRLVQAVSSNVEPLAIVVLMPVFFALAGLSTTSQAFAPHSLGTLVLILGVAIVGKVAGGAIGARVAGLAWRDSLTTGTLMNARGLMEIVVIKVGLDAGLIRVELFTILLTMAVVTTAITGPISSWLARSQTRRAIA